MISIQEQYPPEFSHCYGCGTRNPHGHKLKTYLDTDGTIARFTPGEQYSGGIPGNVYGGMVASLLDCHGTASAAAFHRRHAEANAPQEGPMGRFVTASLKIDFLAPTPQHQELTIRGRLQAIERRKVWVELTLQEGSVICAKGTMLAIHMM